MGGHFFLSSLSAFLLHSPSCFAYVQAWSMMIQKREGKHVEWGHTVGFSREPIPPSLSEIFNCSHLDDNAPFQLVVYTFAASWHLVVSLVFLLRSSHLFRSPWIRPKMTPSHSLTWGQVWSSFLCLYKSEEVTPNVALAPLFLHVNSQLAIISLSSSLAS